MTNNTIPNVPRELEPCPFCGSEAGRATKKATWNLSRHRVACTNSGCGAHYGYWHPIEWNARALLSAPSPAGVGGLDVVGWYRMDDRKAITPYPSVCATWHKMGVKVGAAYSDSAHAIIDGLRGEVEVMTQHANNYSRMFEECSEERDHQAKRIGELEGLLLRVQVSLSLDDTEWGYSGAEKYKLLADIRTALSAGKDAAP